MPTEQAALAEQLDAFVLALRSALSPDRAELSLTAVATLARLDRTGPARLTELAVAEGVSQPTMTALIARLAGAGLVRRDADPHDGRVVVLTLTDAGRDHLARRRAARAERLSGPLGDLSPEELRRVADALPVLTRLADAARRSRIPVEVSR